VTGAERFRTAALAALAYERHLFSPEAGNWPDLRDLPRSGKRRDAGQSVFSTGWCHGAPGIGLARLRSLPHLDDATTRAEIDAALADTLAHGFGRDHSLCHGDLGNLELLLQASETLDDTGSGPPARLRARASEIAASVLESIEREGWRCGNPTGVESPGLMTGLAGIGYGLLRLAEPARIPSVLVLAAPPNPRSSA
jgi:lantibiotic modifying enzyme